MTQSTQARAVPEAMTGAEFRQPPVPVLVVDDDASKRQALKASLSPLDCVVEEADSGRAALHRVGVRDFAVILLDVVMPTMDGFETAALIRQHRQCETTPIIFVTAFDDGELSDADRFAHGVVDFMFAPVSPSELRAKVTVFANLFTNARELATRAREAQSSADHLRLVTDIAPIGIFQTDAENKYVYTNPRWSGITGVGPDQAVGNALDTIIASELRSDLMSQLELPGETGAELSYRFEIPRSDAKPRIAQMTAVAIPDGEGGRAGLIGIVADVTAEAGAEAAMSRARDTANTASRMKSDFLANMSHEIRTPMNGVIGMTDLLLETDLDARQRDYAQTVRNSGEALLTIINDILDFSKVEAGMLTIDHEDFALRAVIDDVADLLASSAQSKGIELVAVVDASVSDVVRGDAGRLRQILMNLVGNAIKFTQAGEVVIRVSQHDVEGAETMVRFEVRDTGDGIEPEKIGVIFQPFVQADTSTSRLHGGTGLGLAITGHLVTLMGGDFGVTSCPGQGSTFWCTIPASATSGQDGEPASFHPDLAGLPALVVDDNASQRAVLSDYLRGWGMLVTAVDTAANALSALRDAAGVGMPFAVALLDQSMPGMGGVQLKDAIVADASSATALVLMTDLAWRYDMTKPEAAGFCAALSKPVHENNLLDCLHSALNIADGVPSDHPVSPPGTVAGSKVGRILLAEDNLVNQEVTVAMLSWAGYQVDTVLDGAAAVEANRARRYDLILMDCQMPELSGYEATAAIRAEEGASRHTPIAAMTAGARSEDRELCLASGMDSYLAKPVKKDALLRFVAASISDWLQVSDETLGRGTGALDDPVLDRVHFDEVCTLGHLHEETFVAELVGQFVYDSEWRIVELRAAVEADDAPAVGRNAYVIQGGSAQMGGRRLAEACRHLRRRAAADMLAGARDDLDEIEGAFEELRRELAQQVFAGGRPPRRRHADVAAILTGDRWADGVGADVPTTAQPRPIRQGAHNCVLMAQDNPVSQRIARAMFEKLGHEVDVVSDGEEAVAAAILRPYRAIFIDCNLPTLNGYQAAEEIRRLQGAIRTPIIAITESLTAADKRRCMSAGMDDFIAVPFNLETIDAALTQWPRRHPPPRLTPDPADVRPEPDPAGSIGPALDLNVLEQLERLGESAGEDLVGRLAVQFLADAGCRMAELREGLADANADQVIRAAHDLRGSSSNLGASELARLCSTFSKEFGPEWVSRDLLVLEMVESELGRVRTAFEMRSLSG
jgi:PAS domain S-box-containing protein